MAVARYITSVLAAARTASTLNVPESASAAQTTQ
jgi:hypothetical protein